MIFVTAFLNAENLETFYQTGELKERFEIKDGVREGLYQKWYLNGQIGKQSFYKNGVLDGELTIWYRTVLLRQHIQYQRESYKEQ